MIATRALESARAAGGLPREEGAAMVRRATLLSAFVLTVATVRAQTPAQDRMAYSRAWTQLQADAGRLRSACEDGRGQTLPCCGAIQEFERIGSTASQAPAPPEFGAPASVAAACGFGREAVGCRSGGASWIPHASIADVYRGEGRRRRGAQAGLMQKPIEAFMADDKAWREGLRLADPIPPPPSADAARAAVEVFRPCNPDVATQMAKALDDEEAHAKVLLADETQCRATPSCSAARAAERAAAEAARVAARKAQAAQEAGNAVCYDLSEIQDEKTRIANERTNPSGVMDLQVMHDAGDRLRTDQENLARDKAAYLKATGKPFNLKCVSQ